MPHADPGGTTAGALVARALEAYAALTTLGEDVEDEWSYVTDLTEAWRQRLEAAVSTYGDASLD